MTDYLLILNLKNSFERKTMEQAEKPDRKTAERIVQNWFSSRFSQDPKTFVVVPFEWIGQDGGGNIVEAGEDEWILPPQGEPYFKSAVTGRDAPLAAWVAEHGDLADRKAYRAAIAARQLEPVWSPARLEAAVAWRAWRQQTAPEVVAAAEAWNDRFYGAGRWRPVFRPAAPNPTLTFRPCRLPHQFAAAEDATARELAERLNARLHIDQENKKILAVEYDGKTYDAGGPTATPMRLFDGEWGAWADFPVLVGDAIQIVTKKGRKFVAFVNDAAETKKGGWVCRTTDLIEI